MTANNASMSVEMFRIMTGQSSVIKSVTTDKVVNGIAISGTTATLPEAPKTSGALTVFLADSKGRDFQELTKVASAPTNGQYSITGTTITVASGTAGTLNVSYQIDEEREVIEAKGGTPPTFRMVGKCVAKDLETGLLYSADIIMPKATVSASYEIKGANKAEAPDSVPLELDLLFDSSVGYPFAITFKEDNTLA